MFAWEKKGHQKVIALDWQLHVSSPRNVSSNHKGGVSLMNIVIWVFLRKMINETKRQTVVDESLKTSVLFHFYFYFLHWSVVISIIGFYASFGYCFVEVDVDSSLI